ncbi:MAG: RNA-binding protein, partial [Nitrososphaerota archaeon]|nr:RNA-binding protein [Nitrososphaerota archaeon]
MSFEKLLRVPLDRVGALIGKKGETKSKIEESCRVSIAVDGKTG